MTNPFLRRATEFIRDDSAFLAIVSPEPLSAFLAKHPKRDALFDMPVRLIGTPGSGKTMMATLVEFRLLETILRDQSSANNRILASVLASTGFSDGDLPLVAAVRVPMESEYRDYWELPYEESVRTKLVLSLVQSRAMLSLVRNVTANRRRGIEEVSFISRGADGARHENIGAPTAAGVLERAREVERAVYAVGSSLLPPPIDQLPAAAREPYQPFESLRELELGWNDKRIRVRILVILDDAHTLHPQQFEALFRAMTRREMQIGRWMMMRFDALSPSSVFQSPDDDALPGLKRDRDYLDIFMQSPARTADRKQFRKLAGDMSDRYLRLVSALRDRNFTQFDHLLGEEPPRLTEARLDELKRLVDRDQRKLKVPAARKRSIEQLVENYAKGAQTADIDDDVQLAMIRILMHRYIVRLAEQTPSLFDDGNPDPKTPLKADSEVAGGARLHLAHRYARPFHFGFHQLCDASNENAELFLQLAGALVGRMETRAIRSQDPALTPAQQSSILRERAGEIIDGWAFPFARNVRALVDNIARECLKESLLDNAPLGPGANAIAIPDNEMDAVLKTDSELARVLKFAQAYGAIVAIRGYGQGGKLWCLLELCGPACLKYGLTLRRGGFLELRAEQLLPLIEAL